MSESAFRSFAESKGFHHQTLSRWHSWADADRAALAQLAVALKIGENQLRDMMDWSEEIALRDGIGIAAILGGKAVDAIATDPRLGRADKVKRIKEQLRRRRFPRLAQAEDAIQEKIRALKLPPEIHVSVPAGLEGGKLHVEFSAASQGDLQRLADKLAAAAPASVAGEIFTLLGAAKVSAQSGH